MIKSKILATAAVASLALAPVAAQAGTRAESSPVSIDVSRASAPVAGQSDLFRMSPALILLLLALIAAIIALASGGRSRG
jgi:hypothetical protein